MMHSKAEADRAIEGGLAGGLVGGAAFSILMAAANLLTGKDFWGGVKAAGTPFLHARSLQPGFDFMAVVIGVASHFAVSLVWGVAFGVLAYGLSRGAALWAGAGWGAVCWIVMHYAVLPMFGLGALVRGESGLLALTEHVVFGLAVAVGFLSFQEAALPQTPNVLVRRRPAHP